ncbi:PrgI family protein [Patescibacteria group bacterium]|nr:PrgI family protein [Patescibacteria group bacterium]
MEQHPVPQNVSTFQFRLIGDMTLKQFGYLALGAICAYISYKLPLPTIFTWPIAAGFGLLGVGFAFVPIEERPMDVWVLSFFKSAYSPTQYVWQRGQQAPSAKTIVVPKAGRKSQAPYRGSANVSQDQSNNGGATASKAQLLDTFFRVPRSDQQTSGDDTEGAWNPSKNVPLPMYNPFRWLKDWFLGNPTIQTDWRDAARYKQGLGQQHPETEGVAPNSTQSADRIQQKTLDLEKQLQGLRVELQAKAASEGQMAEMQKQLAQTLSEKNKLEQELAALHKKASQPPSPMYPPMPGAQRPFMGAVPPLAGRGSFSAPGRFAQPATKGPTVRVIPKDAAVKAGIPRLTSFPNVVTGIIKDGEGGLLPGVLITVRDKDGVPLRALKSNKLGQFAASTPLPDGTYIVEVEDPRDRYVFDKAQITLGGRVLPPIEILAKSQKELTREKLEKEIFGNQGI